VFTVVITKNVIYTGGIVRKNQIMRDYLLSDYDPFYKTGESPETFLTDQWPTERLSWTLQILVRILSYRLQSTHQISLQYFFKTTWPKATNHQLKLKRFIPSCNSAHMANITMNHQIHGLKIK